MSSASGPHLRIVRDQPMVTISAFVVEFRKEEGATAVGTSIDFRHHAIRVVADGPASLEQAFWANAQHGLVDGALEHLLPQVGKEGSTSTASPGLDTSGAVAAARAAGIEVRAEAGANARALLQGPLAVAGGDRLAPEVLDSTAVVTPVRPVAVANAQRLGLWAIDLTTGHIDALIDNGTHGTIVEYKFIEAEMAFAAFTVRVCVSVFGPGKPICQYIFEQWLELAELALRWAYKVID